MSGDRRLPGMPDDSRPPGPPRRMRLAAALVLGGLLLLAASIAVIVFIGIPLALRAANGDLAYPRFDELKVGDGEAKVLEILGEPAERADVLPACVALHDTGLSRHAGEAEPGVETWFVYTCGLDQMILIGFDAVGRIVFLEKCGT